MRRAETSSSRARCSLTCACAALLLVSGAAAATPPPAAPPPISSCACVTGPGWDISAASSSGDPALVAASVLGGDCFAAIVADCQAGGPLSNATECDPASLVGTIRLTGSFGFTQPPRLFRWLADAAARCQAVPCMTNESLGVFSPPLRASLQWGVSETCTYIFLLSGLLGLPRNAWQPFHNQGVDGRLWSKFQMSDYEDLGFTKGQASAAMQGWNGFLETFSQPGSFDPHDTSFIPKGPVLVYPQVILERLVEVDPPNHFEIEYYVNFAWHDRRIFHSCNGYRAEADQPDGDSICSLFWQPNIELPDAVESTIVQELGLTTQVGDEWGAQSSWAGLQHSLAYRQYRQRAKFMVVLDYLSLPFDKHALNFTMRMPGANRRDRACFEVGEPHDATSVELPASQLGSGWKPGDQARVWNGKPHQVRASGKPRHQIWDVTNFEAYSESIEADPLLGLETSEWANANNPAMMLRQLALADNESLALIRERAADGTYHICQVTFSIEITRRNWYHILNYIVMQLVLVLLGWCTFFLPPESIDARLGIAFTMVLAINVFQIVLVENLPETGDLSRLQWFTILNTIVLGLIAVESVVVCGCARALERRHELDRHVKKFVNRPDAHRAVRRIQRAARRLILLQKVAVAVEESLDPQEKGPLSWKERGSARLWSGRRGRHRPSDGWRWMAVRACAEWGDIVAATLLFPVLLAVSLSVSLTGTLTTAY